VSDTFGDLSRPSWLDEQQPHDEAHSQAQIAGLLELLAPAAKRVLDLGCGAGRVLVPLAVAGHELLGLDRDAEALRLCLARLEEQSCTANLMKGDFRGAGSLPVGPFDAVLCLGNTFMTIADVDEAVELLIRVRRVLRAGGTFIIDDCPRDFWPELTEGNWLSGLSEDGNSQLVWEGGDAVFALRHGREVDPDNWQIGPDERRYRLWSDGALRLAARAAGLSGPRRLDDAPLLVMRPPRA
jgi:SAM-dependent methyltransferase